MNKIMQRECKGISRIKSILKIHQYLTTHERLSWPEDVQYRSRTSTPKIQSGNSESRKAINFENGIFGLSLTRDAGSENELDFSAYAYLLLRRGFLKVPAVEGFRCKCLQMIPAIEGFCWRCLQRNWMLCQYHEGWPEQCQRIIQVLGSESRE